MPIYMDRHDVSSELTAEIVADLHLKDLKVQHKFKCVGLTYWFDDKRKTAFCLVEAPDKNAIEAMHNHAHGAVPHKIIEVDGSVVESFLGRIEDPEKSKKASLNIINDPAFRTIMVFKPTKNSLLKLTNKRANLMAENRVAQIIQTIAGFKGRIVKQKTNYFMVSFDSVTNAVLCAIDIQKDFEQPSGSNQRPHSDWQLGLSAGVPVSKKEGIFEDTIQLADRLCEFVQGRIVVSSEVKDLYESENLNIALDLKRMTAVHSTDEIFLNLLMDYTEREWRNTTLNVGDFSKNLGFSKSQLYRKMILLTGKSPNVFLKDYRLHKAVELLNKKTENISGIAFETGFNTPAYFSKCFQNAFGILPSIYLKSVYS